MPEPSSQPRRSMVGLKAVLLALPLALLLGACYPGEYPVDIFPEMHYQASYRPFEPPRLSAPASAVPVTGKEIAPADFAAAGDLRNPISASPQELERSQRLYQVNCLPCHGRDGRGDGIVAQYFKNAQAPPPVDFASARARSRTDGQLFFIISSGLGNMPAFQKLVGPDDRWRLILFIRQVQAQNPAS